jgi:branched-chain amino acid transport system substrate-binding protein
VIARRVGLAALAVVGAGLTGCAGASSTGSNEAVGGELAIYSSLPLQGPLALISQQIVGGEKLALAATGGRVGHFKIDYVSLDDSNTTDGRWSPGEASSDAKTAAQDTSTIAYLGDYNSGATAISLPLINGAGIPQVSPSSPYAGLTSSQDAGQDEPERFYPSGHRSFLRLGPGDPLQAMAQVQLMASLGVSKVYVLNEVDPFELPLASLVASDAEAAGIAVAGHDQLTVSTGASYKGEIEKITSSGAGAVFFSGQGTEAAAALWTALHEADRHLLLLGPSSLAEEDSFAPMIGAAAASTYLTTPALPAHFYGDGAQRILSHYHRLFGGEPTAYVLYGYEAMSVVLAAIRHSGAHGNDRQVVTGHLLATRDRESVLGHYSVNGYGEATLSRFAVDRVEGGLPVFYRELTLP